MKFWTKILVILALLSLCACSQNRFNRPAKIAAVRKEAGNIKTVEIPVSRKSLAEAIKLGNPTNKIRMVPVFQGSGAGGGDDENEPPPQYRFFDINSESAYYMLGIRNGDVLVAAHDYIVWDPNKFAAYVGYIPSEPDAYIEIRRAGEPLLFKYNLTE